MKIAAIAFAGATALALTACSGGDAPADESPAPSTSPTLIAESTTPDPEIGNQDDALCAAAGANLEEAAELEAKTQELTDLMQDPAFLTDTDPTVLNEWGEDLLALTAGTKEFYELGVDETEGEDVNADFVMLDTFAQSYSIALATAAAEAESTMDFFASMQELFTDASIRETLQAVPDAASNVGVYLTERCDITG
jgi:hypothetical protein